LGSINTAVRSKLLDIKPIKSTMATTDPMPEPVLLKDTSFSEKWATHAIKQRIFKFQQKVAAIPTSVPTETEAAGDLSDELLPCAETLRPAEGEKQEEQVKSFKVAIVGAGVTGLFTALLFDYLADKFKLEVEYEILESNVEQRVGGRLYTYQFEDKTDGKYPLGKHSYFDVGAMRFPKVKTMEKTFALFDVLGMKEIRTSPTVSAEPGNLIPYKFEGKNVPLLYNSVRVIPDQDIVGKRGVTAKDFHITNLPTE
jgi:hypothetical protein